MVCPDTDVLVAGGGPAGFALAAELARRGVRVALAERNLGKPWLASYGCWEPTWLPGVADDAVLRRFDRPTVTFQDGSQKGLTCSYLRLDTARLQANLERRATEAGVQLLHAEVERLDQAETQPFAETSDSAGRTSRYSARLIVDCRGRSEAAPTDGQRAKAFQSAFGAWFEVDDLPPELRGMCLMDLRSTLPHERDVLAQPSFLYAMQEKPGVLFAQETVLASRRAAPFRVLEMRLRRRLDELGVRLRREVRRERCLIPLGANLPDEASSRLAFGAAAGMVQPASGYSLARVLRLAPSVAAAITTVLDGTAGDAQPAIEPAQRAIWPDEARKSWALYQLGLESLLDRDPAHDNAFWRAFFDLPDETVAHFLDGGLPRPALVGALWRVFLRVPLRLRFDLAVSGLRFLSRPSTQRGVS